MTILTLDQFSELGGAQQVLLDLIPAFQARRWDVRAAIPGSGALSERLRAIGIEPERIDCGPYECGRKTAADFVRFLQETPALRRQIRGLAGRADLVYVNGPRMLPAVAFAALDAPVVFHAHSALPRGVAGRLSRAALRRLVPRIIANSEFVARSWGGCAPFVSVVYNGVRPQATPSRRNGRTVACIGRIAPEKGQLHFVDAVARIRKEIAGCRFVIHGASLFAGESYEREVRARAAAMGVEVTGWTEDVSGVLASTDLLLVPSSPVEATTRVIIEAFAAGTPVVAFGNGGIPEVINHRRTGFLAQSAEEMARFAILLLRDPGLKAEISAGAYQSWRDRFTLERFCREIAGEVERALLPVARRQPLRPAWGRSRSA